MERKLTLPRGLGTEFQSPEGELTLLWNDFDLSTDLAKGMVICLDEKMGRIVVLTQESLLEMYQQIPDYNLKLEFEEE